MVELLRHRQTQEPATDMFSLKPPRHIPTLPEGEVTARLAGVRSLGHNGPDLLRLSSSHFDPSETWSASCQHQLYKIGLVVRAASLISQIYARLCQSHWLFRDFHRD